MRRASKKNPIILPTQSRSKETFNAILEGATNILKEYEWENFTTNNIAEESGVSIASIYQYFYDKNAILKKLINDLILRDYNTIRQYIEKDYSKKDLKQLILFSISQYSYRPKLRKKLNKYNLAIADDSLVKEVITYYEDLVSQFIKKDYGHIKDEKIAASLVVHTLMWNCNGFLEKDILFYKNKLIVQQISLMILKYLKP